MRLAKRDWDSLERECVCMWWRLTGYFRRMIRASTAEYDRDERRNSQRFPGSQRQSARPKLTSAVRRSVAKSNAMRGAAQSSQVRSGSPLSSSKGHRGVKTQDRWVNRSRHVQDKRRSSGRSWSARPREHMGSSELPIFKGKLSRVEIRDRWSRYGRGSR